MQLQKPVEEEKPKPAQGEEEQKEEEPEGEEKKKKFDIYEYEWTRPTIHKNLSQWFFKLKKTIVQVNLVLFSAKMAQRKSMINSDKLQTLSTMKDQMCMKLSPDHPIPYHSYIIS